MPTHAETAGTYRQAGPPLWLPATIFALLFCAGLALLMRGSPAFPGPDVNDAAILEFMRARSDAVRLCAALQFGAGVPLGILTAGLVARLRFLGVDAVGPSIALFGGFAAAIAMMIAASILWALSFVGGDVSGAGALFRLSFALGGPGFSVPFGLLIAGIAIPCAIMKLVPRWLAGAGLLLALLGELSWLTLFDLRFLPLVPLTRFPGFSWLILVAILLPATRANASAQTGV